MRGGGKGDGESVNAPQNFLIVLQTHGVAACDVRVVQMPAHCCRRLVGARFSNRQMVFGAKPSIYLSEVVKTGVIGPRFAVGTATPR